jgi:hypothetical protein
LVRLSQLEGINLKVYEAVSIVWRERKDK